MERDVLLAMAEKERSSPIAFFVRNRHMTILVLVGIVLGGFFAIRSMPIESDPEVKIPIGTVTTVYPGASPADVEKLVTDEIEDRLESLDDIKQITSTSSEGVSVIVVEFQADADIENSIRKLRDEVDSAKGDLPSEVDNDPIVRQIRADDRSVITFTMIGERPFEDFKRYVDDLQEQFEHIRGVDKVVVSGLPNEEMQVLVNPQALESHQLSITQVVSAIASNHIDFPIGSVRTDEFYYQVSLKGQFVTAEDVQSVVVQSTDGRDVRIGDIAEVRKVFGYPESQAHLYQSDTHVRQQAIAMGIYKKVGEDLVTMADAAKGIATTFEKTTLPDDMSILVTDDESERIRDDIRNLLRSAWQTVLIIAITLFLALGTREAIAASLSIPILYLGSFIGLALLDQTFNFLTFFALILSLGVVVDTSIVITEGINENMRTYGMSARDAALASIAVFKAPLTAGSLTTIAAFLPLALMSGILGEYVKFIPITVNLTLIASIFTALMLLPPIAVFLLRNEAKPGRERKPPLLAPLFHRISTWYSGFLKRILESNRQQRLWLAGLAGAFLLSGVLVATGIVKFQLFSNVDVDIFSITIRAPEGASLERTRVSSEKAEKIAQTIPELKRYVVINGDGSSNRARINITLTKPNERDRKSYDITEEIRKQLPAISEAEVLIEELQAGPPTGADIDLRLLGNDVRDVEQYAAAVQEEMKHIPGATDVRSDLELSPGEYAMRPRRDRLEYFGITTQQIGSTLRSAVFGNDSVKIKSGGDETPIVVQLDYRNRVCVQDPVTQLLVARDGVTFCNSNPEDISVLLNLLIPTSKGQVPLSELVTVELVSAVTTIRHFNNDRVVSVKADVAEGYVLADVLRTITNRLDQMNKPENISIQYGGENEETTESLQSLGQASIFALLIIFALLVYQFGSFRQVGIILTTMPMAIMGVLYGLAIIRLPMSFPGMIGLVALLGIVVNDAIVLIDRFNTIRAGNGMTLAEAVHQGSVQRLEPVIMTTLTTALGVLPLIFTGETFRDLAIVVSIGITIASIFTLIVIPILYLRFEGDEPGLLKKGYIQIAQYIQNLRGVRM